MARYLFQTALSPEVCRSRLEMRCRSWRRPFTVRGRPIKGRVGPQGFSVEKHTLPLLSNPFKPRARGTWSPVVQGTSILLNVGLPPARIILLILEFTFNGILLLLFLVAFLTPQAGASSALSAPSVVALAVIVLLLVGGWTVSWSLARRQGRFLQDFIRTTLEAEEVGPSASSPTDG